MTVAKDRIETEAVAESRASFEEALAAKSDDASALDHVDGVLSDLRGVRLDNHWTTKIEKLFRGAA